MSKQYFIRENQRKANIDVPVSKAAERLYYRLLNKGYKATLENPDYAVPITIDGRTVPHTPDIMLEDVLLPIEVDGPRHLKPKFDDRDSQVNFAFLDAGYKFPVRLQYNGGEPSEKLLTEWVGKIEARIEARDSVKYWETQK